MTSEPLFVHSLHGGGWRVLRWLKSDGLPILATEGPLLAVGVVPDSCDCAIPQRPPGGGRMDVSVLDLATGRLVARFQTPEGELSFASSGRLALWRQLRDSASAAAGPPPRASDALPIRRALRRYRLVLYSLRGHRIGEAPPVPEGALVSDMHVLYEEDAGDGESVLVVRSLLGGPPRRLIGLDEARTVLGVAFRWPAVAVEQTVSAPLSQSEVTCSSGEYHKPSAPFLTIFDLDRPEPFVPAPPLADLVPPPPSAYCPPHLVSPAR